MIKYFLAAMTIAEDKQWVNLSPYEKSRIIDDDFGKTEMGRDVLAQDYMLKQITASLLYPENAVGKEFWKQVYTQASIKYGITNIPINTFNKVWITPDKASVYEKDRTVLIVESKLKVQLEQDYLAMNRNGNVGDPKAEALSARSESEDRRGAAGAGPAQVASQVLRDIIIPILTKEVNEGKNFANLRQMFHGMILATWYKQALKKSILTQAYANQNKVQGVNLSNPIQSQQEVYQQYIKAFKKGVYNFIKEDQDPITGQLIPRKYFSGGYTNIALNQAMTTASEVQAKQIFDAAIVSRLDAARTVIISSNVSDSAMVDHVGISATVGVSLLAKDWKEGDVVVRKSDGKEGVIAGTPSLRIENKIVEVLIVRFGQELIRYYRHMADEKLSFLAHAGSKEIEEVGQAQRSLTVSELVDKVIKGGNKNKKQRLEYERMILDKFGEEINTADELKDALLVLLIFPSALEDEVFYRDKGTEGEEDFLIQLVNLVLNYVRENHMYNYNLDEDENIRESYQVMVLPVLMALIKEKKLIKSISKGTIQKLKANMPVMVKPFKTLREIVNIQKIIGNFEMNIEIINQPDGNSLVMLSKEGTHAALGRFGQMDLGPEGHTHAFYDLPLERSSGDDRIAKERRTPSFILGFDRNSDAVELAYYMPSTKRWTYVQDHSLQGQDIIAAKLKEFGLLSDRAMNVDLAGLEVAEKVIPYGGIDFNPLGFQLKRDGQGMPLPLSNQDPAMSDFQGLEPRIVEITSAVNLPIFNELRQYPSIQPTRSQYK